MSIATSSAPLSRTPKVYRHVALAVSAFDRLKDWQRHFERTGGRRVTNGETLDRLLLALPLPSYHRSRKDD